MELYLNTTTGEWFDAAGNPFANNTPQIAYKQHEFVMIWMKESTPDAGELGVNPREWPVSSYSYYADLGALLTVDNDYTHKLQGVTNSDYAAGAVATITATIAEATNALLPSKGTVRVFSSAGTFESLLYESRSINGTSVTFTLAKGSTLANSYNAGAVCDCDQAPYLQAYFIPEYSVLSDGMLQFELIADSLRLREAFDYGNVESLPVQGMELLLFGVSEDGTQTPMASYLLDTFALVGTLGAVGMDAEIPDPTKNQLAALVGMLMNQGLLVESRQNGGQTELRVKLANLSSDAWSDWFAISTIRGADGEKGDKGDKGEDGYTPVRGVDYYTAEDVAVLLEELKVRLAKTRITDNTSTTVTLSSLQTNALYEYTQPLTSLTIDVVEDTTLETDISFTAGEGFQLYVPEDVKVITNLGFNAGNNYLINIYAKRLVAGEFEG